jgi:hypothetical protein
MKSTPARSIAPTLVLAAASALCLGCQQSESMAVTASCSTTLLVAGSWNGTFKCENGSCITGDDRFEVAQSLTDLTQVTATIVASTLPGDSGSIFRGELCGNTFTWEAIDPGNDESGEWVFSDDQHFTKTSTFDGGEFSCVGAGTREPLPLPAPFFCPLP